MLNISGHLSLVSVVYVYDPLKMLLPAAMSVYYIFICDFGLCFCVLLGIYNLAQSPTLYMYKTYTLPNHDGVQVKWKFNQNYLCMNKIVAFFLLPPSQNIRTC
jgi:hypothetical protein